MASLFLDFDGGDDRAILNANVHPTGNASFTTYWLVSPVLGAFANFCGGWGISGNSGGNPHFLFGSATSFAMDFWAGGFSANWASPVSETDLIIAVCQYDATTVQGIINIYGDREASTTNTFGSPINIQDGPITLGSISSGFSPRSARIAGFAIYNTSHDEATRHALVDEWISDYNLPARTV